MLQNKAKYPLSIIGMARLFVDCYPEVVYLQRGEKWHWSYHEKGEIIPDMESLHVEGCLIQFAETIRWAKRRVPYESIKLVMKDEKFFKKLSKQKIRNEILSEVRKIFIFSNVL